MTVNGVELDFSMFNPSHVRKYHESEVALQKKYKAATKMKRKNDIEGYIALLEDACGVILAFFDDCFGNGTSNKVFGSVTDLEKCVDAFEEIRQQMEAQGERMGSKLSRYEPVV